MPDAPDWQAALFARRTLGVRMTLDAVRAVDAALGHPGTGRPVVHLVGTNGKGSTAAMVAHGLRRDGRRVGLYTSPHLVRVGERVRIDGIPVSDESLGDAVARVLAHEGTAPRPLTFFEAITLAALVVLDDQCVDEFVLEAGLGGRLDATRVRRPTLTLVTSIGMDHQRYLGSSLGAIAAEKAGAFAPRIPVLSAPQRPEALAVLDAKAGALGCPFRVVPPADDAPLRGEHQRVNAGLALAALAARGAGELTDPFDGLVWPGRFERLVHGGTHAEVWLDAAHNEEGVVALVDTARAQSTRWAGVLFACADDKPADAMRTRLQTLAPVHVLDLDDARAMVERALMTIVNGAGGDAPWLVCGSHRLVGPVRAALLGHAAVAPDPSDPR